MHILYASQRPPCPYFLGGAARCAHRLHALCHRFVAPLARPGRAAH